MDGRVSGDFLVGDLFDDVLSGQIAQLLLQLEHGSRLPAERELAQQLSVSRTALRDRLSRFASLGVLERRSGAGTFVKLLEPKTMSESLILGFMASHLPLRSLISVRIGLERQAAIEAAVAADPVKIAHMAAALVRMETTTDADLLYAADVEFHRALFVASVSPSLIFFADALSSVLARSVRQRQERIGQLTSDPEVIRSLHRAIYQATFSGDPESAMQAVDAHFAWLDTLGAPRTEGGPTP